MTPVNGFLRNLGVGELIHLTVFSIDRPSTGQRMEIPDRIYKQMCNSILHLRLRPLIWCLNQGLALQGVTLRLVRAVGGGIHPDTFERIDTFTEETGLDRLRDFFAGKRPGDNRSWRNHYGEMGLPRGYAHGGVSDRLLNRTFMLIFEVTAITMESGDAVTKDENLQTTRIPGGFTQKEVTFLSSKIESSETSGLLRNACVAHRTQGKLTPIVYWWQLLSMNPIKEVHGVGRKCWYECREIAAENWLSVPQGGHLNVSAIRHLLPGDRIG